MTKQAKGPSHRRSGPESFYPEWVTYDPIFAREALAAIRSHLEGGKALSDEQRRYLIDAISKIMRGVDANCALYLVRNKGRSSQTFSKRNTEIYNRVTELIGRGKSKAHAFREVAIEQQTKGVKLTEKAIEKIYAAIGQHLKKTPKQISRLV